MDMLFSVLCIHFYSQLLFNNIIIIPASLRFGVACLKWAHVASALVACHVINSYPKLGRLWKYDALLPILCLGYKL